MSANERPAPAPTGTGPSENVAATKPLVLAAQTTASQLSSGVLWLPTPWAQRLIDAADGPIPLYGSPEWAALPDDSRTKVAATVRAAEAWRSSNDPAEIAWRLHLELNHTEPEPEPVWTPEVVTDIRRRASRPRYSELCDRRGEHDRAARARTVERDQLGLVNVHG